MTKEEFIEELLIKAHRKGFREEVLKTSQKIRNEIPNIPFLDSIEEAYQMEKRKRKLLKSNF